MKFIVTVKIVPKNPEHDPRNKKTGTCPVSFGYCTDVTGEHHSMVVDASNAEAVKVLMEKMGYKHVTRIESL